jgi:cobaltochelatase CobT
MNASLDAAAVALHRERLCAAAVRALSGEPELHYRGGRLCRRMRPLPLHAPHLRSDANEDDFASLRGAADGAAMRLVHSDYALHGLLSPQNSVERLLFELFEQIRCEALAAPRMPGLAHNLRHRFAAWSRAYCEAGLADAHLGILVYTVIQLVWSRVNGWRVTEQTEHLIEATRAGIAPTIGVQLAGLRKHRGDQRGYAEPARELARRIRAMLDDAHAGLMDEASDAARKPHAALTSFSLWVDFDEADEEGAGGDGASARRSLVQAGLPYRAYTTQFDVERRAGSLVRQAVLREYRTQLDERIASAGINVARLARVLTSALAVAQRDGWSFGEEEGRVDGRRLARIVSSPAERRVFVQERMQLRGDCVVGFLIDCSASMKAHVEPVAMLVDTIARASEHAGIATEVLGFTTGAWNGGRTRSEWLARGRPRHPGRLNEICHMVLKRAQDSWRRARTDIAALFKADLFREGVDGEAVQWACERLSAQAFARRILVVVSDGSPMDTATVQANGASYLDDHLKDVLARCETRREVDVIGLGVGADLGLFYRHCMRLDPAAPLDTKRLIAIAKWIGERRQPASGATARGQRVMHQAACGSFERCAWRSRAACACTAVTAMT